VRTHHAQTGDVAVLNAVGWVFFHLGKHVADDFGVFLRLGGADDGDKGELRPGEGVVEVVFEKVVFGEVCDVAGLDGGEEGDVGGVGAEGEDVDHSCCWRESRG